MKEETTQPHDSLGTGWGGVYSVNITECLYTELEIIAYYPVRLLEPDNPKLTHTQYASLLGIVEGHNTVASICVSKRQRYSESST